MDKETQNESKLAVHVKGEYLEAIPASKKTELEKVFSPIFAQADEWAARAQAIKVTNASQVEEMKLAREVRLNLKAIRVNADKVRKDLKSDYLLMSKAIDGIGNVIKALIVPLEKYLQEQEDFVKNAQRKKLMAIKEKREAELDAVDAHIRLYDGVANLSDQEYKDLLKLATDAYESRKREERKREEAIKEAEKKREAERQKAIKKQQEAERSLKLWKQRMNEMAGAYVKKGFICYDDTVITKESKISEVTDKEFGSILKVYKDVKKLKDAFRAQQESRKAQCLELGFLPSSKSKAYVNKEGIYITESEMQTLADSAWNEIMSRAEAAQKKAQSDLEARMKKIAEAEEAERIAKEREEKFKRVAGDKEKLLAFQAKLVIDIPALRSLEARKVLSEAVKHIDAASELILNFTGK